MTKHGVVVVRTCIYSGVKKQSSLRCVTSGDGPHARRRPDSLRGLAGEPLIDDSTRPRRYKCNIAAAYMHVEYQVRSEGIYSPSVIGPLAQALVSAKDI